MFTIDVWNDKEISINATQQKWTAKDCKDLLQSDIVYEPGIVAAWIEKRKDNEPLIHLMSEDDGHLFWSKYKDVHFSSCWLDNYMSVLSKTKSYILKHNKKFNIKKWLEKIYLWGDIMIKLADEAEAVLENTASVFKECVDY